MGTAQGQYLYFTGHCRSADGESRGCGRYDSGWREQTCVPVACRLRNTRLRFTLVSLVTSHRSYAHPYIARRISTSDAEMPLVPCNYNSGDPFLLFSAVPKTGKG